MKKIQQPNIASKFLNGIVTKVNAIIDKLIVDVKVNGESVVTVNDDGEREADIDLSLADQNVKQSPTTDNKDYRVLLSKSDNDTEETDIARKNTNLKYNPSTGNLQATKLNGNTIPSGSGTDTLAKTSDIPDMTNYIQKSLTAGLIKNDGTIDQSDYVESSDLAIVATSGSYNDLIDKPTIPAGQVQSDWEQDDNTEVDYIKNKPTLATVATSGSYNDLTNKPTIPTVNNATLTIQKNGTDVQTFTANASSNKTANIIVPTALSDLTDDINHRLVTDTEKSAWNAKANTSDITSAINNLDVASISIEASETLGTIKEDNGKIAVTVQDISITKSQISNFSHSHGNITNDGALQTVDVTIGNSDRLVITDHSDSGKIARTSTTFDGSTTTKALTPKGTFETFSKLVLGDTLDKAYYGDKGKTAYEHSQMTSGNPHNVTKSDVGLGSVPNVTTNNQKPTFTQASTRTNLVSNTDTLSTIMGKIMKWFDDLKDLAFITKDGSTSKYLRGDGQWTTFPTIPTITDTYSGTSSNGMSGKAVKSAIDALNGGTIGTPSVGKTLTALSQSNGNISATFEDISIVKSQISNLGNPERTVRQTLRSTDTNYPLLMSYGDTSNTNSNVDNIVYRNNSIYVNPSNKMITVDSAIYSRWIDALIKPTFWVKKPSSGTGANAGLALDTKGGRWGLFTYPSSDENLRFLYFTDAKIADPSTSDANSPNASFYINGANNTVYANIIDTKLQTTDITIASGDKLVVTDSSDSAKVRRASISFDGSTATKALTQKGTWETFTSNTGTVTKVSTGAGLTGGDVTTTGTIKCDLKSETKSSLTAASKGSTSSREYAVGLDANGDLSVNIPWTDTKVTTAGNHYAPETASGGDKTASATGATAAWSIDVVKGVTLNTDGKGHVTGISVTSGKIPSNPVLALDVAQTTVTAGKTISTWKQADGLVTIATQDISITKSQVSDFSHTHGNIQNNGLVNGDLKSKYTNVNLKATNNGVSSNIWAGFVTSTDNNDLIIGQCRPIIYTAGNVGYEIGSRNYDSTGAQTGQCYIRLITSKEGASSFQFSDKDAFRRDLGIPRWTNFNAYEGTGNKTLMANTYNEVFFSVHIDTTNRIDLTLSIPIVAITGTSSAKQQIRQGYNYATTAFGFVSMNVWINSNKVCCNLYQVFQNNTTNIASSTTYDVYYC